MNSAVGTIHFNLSFSQNSFYLRVRLSERFVNPKLLKQLAVYKIKGRFKMNSAVGTIHFNLSFSQNSVYLCVRLSERFVNPQLLKQLAVYKIKES